MRRAMAALAAIVAMLTVATAHADEGDAVRVPRGPLQVGDQLTISIDVATERGATVEVDPAAKSWNGVEVIGVAGQRSRDLGDRTLHTLDVVVAPFVPGEISFQPGVNVVVGAEVTARTLPQAGISVDSVLRPDDPLKVSPLAPPGSISGGEAPWLRPAIASGVVATLLLLAGAIFVLVRMRLRRPGIPPAESPAPAPGLEGAAALLEHDPVGAYRRLAGAVRGVLAERYGFPAPALTTLELRLRMEAEGVDRWQARLVTGLLEECDAVVYAGYRPAIERREADLTMAREIVEATA